MKIIVTGANSFIGHRLVERAVESGWDVLAVARPGQSSERLAERYHVLPLVMEEYGDLGKLTGGCDCFVHLAWNGTRAGARMDAQLQRSNVAYSMRAVESILAAGCARVVTAGSQAEYGPHEEKISENSECRPNTEYGKAKLAFYRETAERCARRGIEWKEPRFFSLYGPKDYENTMIMSMLKNMLKDYPCRLTQGVQMWDFLYIDDAIEGMLRLCSRGCPNGVYNFGSGDVRRLKDYVLEMARLTKTKSELLFGSVPYPQTGMVSLWPDIGRLCENLKWEPKVSFAQGILNVMRFLRDGDDR